MTWLNMPHFHYTQSVISIAIQHYNAWKVYYGGQFDNLLQQEQKEWPNKYYLFINWLPGLYWKMQSLKSEWSDIHASDWGLGIFSMNPG